MDNRIPNYIKQLFWDVKKDTVDIELHAQYIIRRVLDFGDVKAINWLRRVYSDTLIREVVQVKRGLVHKTIVFWTEHYNQML